MKKRMTYFVRTALIGTVGLGVAWFTLPDDKGYVPPQAIAAEEAVAKTELAMAEKEVVVEAPVKPANPAPDATPADAPAPEETEPELAVDPGPNDAAQEPAALEEVEVNETPEVQAQSLPISNAQKGEGAKPAPAKAPAQSKRWNEDQAVAAVEQYFRSSETLRASFTQYAPNGARSTGVLSLKRPGRVRFEYDAPSPLLIIADGVWITLADKEMDTVDRYPVSATPLGVILQDDKSLRKETLVTGFYQDADRFELVVRSRDNPGLGRLSLKLTKNPVMLDGWAVEDAQGLVTEIRLTDIKTGMELAPALFHISDVKKIRDR